MSSPATELAGQISRALVGAARRSRAAGKWTYALDQTLHGLRCRESLSPPLVATVIDPHLLHYPSLSLGFFNWASQQPNFRHSQASYHSILKSLTVYNQFGALEKVLEQARVHGVFVDPSVYRSAILSRVKSGKIREAFDVFGQGSGCWNSVLAALASEGHVECAHKVFGEMLVRGVCFNTLGFGAFVWSCCKDGDLGRVLGLWSEVRKGACEINDSIVAVLLVCRLCMVGRALDAQSALDEMRSKGCKPDFMAYRVVAEGLRSLGYLAEVEIELKKKRKLGVAPRENDYKEFIFALILEDRMELAKELGKVIIDGDFPIGNDVLNALLSSVSKSDPHSALYFLQYMIEKGRLPTLNTLTSFGKNLCDHGKADELVEILQNLSSCGYFTNLESYSAIVSLLCAARRVREAYGVLEEMRKNGLNPEISSYNELMEALCRDDYLRPARKLWDEMFANGIAADKQTYEILIRKFTETGQCGEAHVLLCQMLEKGFPPDGSTVRSLVESLCQDGKIEAASEVFEKVVGQDMSLLHKLLTPVVLSLCKGGHFQSASKLLCALNYEAGLVESHVILLKYLADAGEMFAATEHAKQIKTVSSVLLQDVSNELLSLASSSSNPDPILQLLHEIYSSNMVPVNEEWRDLSQTWFT